MIVGQVLKSSSQYTSQSINKKIPVTVLAANTVSNIVKTGTKVQHNEHVKRAAKYAADIRKKRLSSEKREEIMLDQHIDIERAHDC